MNENTAGQKPDAYKSGQYFSANVMFAPLSNVTVSGEVQYAHRDNFSDGWSYDSFKIQVSFRYNYSLKLGGKS